MSTSALVRATRAALVLAAAGAIALATACNGDVATAPIGAPVSLAIEGGNLQRSDAGPSLPQPLVVRVLDVHGRPVPGVLVHFIAEDGGSTNPTTVTTGRDGRAASHWTLGPAALPDGSHQARAEFTVAGDTSSTRFSTRSGETVPPPSGLQLLSLTTYDGSGQTVHPDVLPLSAAQNGNGGWLLAITPYPWGNATDENPSLFTGGVGVAFAEPRAGLNPVARPATGHLSDPDIVRDPLTQKIRLYYREASDRNRIWLVESQSITQWSTPRLVASGPNHSIISPSVVRTPDGEWRMYAVDGEGGCSASGSSLTMRRSTNGIDWGAPQRLDLDQPGFSPWHVEVQWVPELGEYWALYNVKTPGGCATPALYLATSRDGARWMTYPAPVLVRGAIREFADIVYRATFHYDAARDVVTIWHSGARYEPSGYRWRSAVETRSRATLLSDVRRQSLESVADLAPAPPLVSWP